MSGRTINILAVLVLLVLPVWWLLKPPGRGRPWLTYRLELWLRAARELKLLKPRTSPLYDLPVIFAVLALAVAAAGPRWGGRRGSASLLVVLDRSPSMAARDSEQKSRFDRAFSLLAARVRALPPQIEVRVLSPGGPMLRRGGGL